MAEPISPQDAVIQMDGVTRRFNGVRAIHDLSLRVEPGSIVGLIGPSGSGKTTAVRMLTGTLEPTEGAIRVLGALGTASLHLSNLLRLQVSLGGKNDDFEKKFLRALDDVQREFNIRR